MDVTIFSAKLVVGRSWQSETNLSLSKQTFYIWFRLKDKILLSAFWNCCWNSRFFLVVQTWAIGDTSLPKPIKFLFKEDRRVQTWYFTFLWVNHCQSQSRNWRRSTSLEVGQSKWNSLTLTRLTSEKRTRWHFNLFRAWYDFTIFSPICLAFLNNFCNII